MTRWEVTFRVPFSLPSLANARLHWTAKANAHRAQRLAAGLAFRTTGREFLQHWRRMRDNDDLCVLVEFVRVGPKALDDDNLAYAFKAIRDEVAATLGLDDGSERFRATYKQRKGESCVEVRVVVTRWLWEE